MHEKGTQEIRIVDISGTCTEKGEDVYDFFVKYGKNKSDLVSLIKEAKVFTESDALEHQKNKYPPINLIDSAQPRHLEKMVTSDVQVMATFDNSFTIPEFIEAEAINIDADTGVKDRRSWVLEEATLRDILFLFDSSLKEKQIKQNIKEMLLKVPPKKVYKVNTHSRLPIYKCVITDTLESTLRNEAQPVQYVAYVFGKKLEAGHNYTIKYKLVTHPLDGQKHVAIVTEVSEANSFVDGMEVTDEVRESLEVFKVPQGSSVKATINRHIQRAKGIVEIDANEKLLTVADL
jgi:hypothetical protein